MFDDLNWNAPITKDFGRVCEIGKVEITPDAVFTIEHHPKERWEQGNYILDGYYFFVGFEIYGCSCGKRFDTRKEVEAYLKDQMDKVPEYESINAKRDAISARMKPLNDKWGETGKQIFRLAKS